jgi:hypothetical protein
VTAEDSSEASPLLGFQTITHAFWGFPIWLFAILRKERGAKKG